MYPEIPKIPTPAPFSLDHPCVVKLINIINVHAVRLKRDENHRKNSAFRDVAEYEGYEMLGGGHFSQAWTHDDLPDHVIKLGFKKEDSGAAYAAWCRDNQDLVGVPTIHAITRLDACYVVLLDKYTPIKGDWSDEYNDRGTVENLRRILDSDHYKPRGTELEDTVHAIKDYFQGIASFDLHSHNAMLDKDGNIIITDPVSFERDEDGIVRYDSYNSYNNSSNLFAPTSDPYNCSVCVARRNKVSAPQEPLKPREAVSKKAFGFPPADIAQLEANVMAIAEPPF